MKLIASDFDGTVYKGGRISEKDIAAIERWQAEGNAFGIVTGRGRDIFDRAKEHGVTLDYAVALNGAQVIDRDGTILHEEVFDLSWEKRYFAFVNQFPQQEEGVAIYAKHDPDGPDSKENVYGIAQLSLVMTSPAEASRVTDLLNEKFGDELVSFANWSCINTVKRGVSKATGIAEYARRFGVAFEDVYAVGDAHNDLPMLEAYDGYVVNSATEEMKARIRNHVEDMEELADIANGRK